MEDKDMRYKQVLDKLKKTEPVLDDAGALTDRIMQRVEQTASDAGKIRVMRISGILSGVAASALICLLAYETLKYPVLPVENHSRIEIAQTSQLYQQKISELNLKDKEEIIEYMFKNREAQYIRKEQLSTSIILSHRVKKSF